MADAKGTSSLNRILSLTPILAILFFGLTLAAGSFFFIKPEIQKYLPGGPFDVEVKKKIVENREMYLKDIRTLDALYEQYERGSTSRVSALLPASKDIPNIFSSYESLARRMRIGLSSIDILSDDGKVKGLVGIKEISLSLRFTHVDYATFKKVLETLENQSRFTDVVSFDIQPDSQLANVTLKTYYASDK